MDTPPPIFKPVVATNLWIGIPDVLYRPQEQPADAQKETQS